MTNIKKPIAFAIASLLVAMPLATTEVIGDNEAILTAACGFTEQNPPSFGTITRGASSITEQTATFSPTPTSTGSGTIFVSANDWDGLGDRASGTITINADIAEDETITVNSLVYTGKDSPSGNTEFLTGASVTAIETAASLATSINARDGGATGVRAYTSGTNVVTIEAEERGTGGNSFTLAESSAGGTSVSAATLSGGGNNVQTHLQAEVTKFKIVSDATTNPTTSTGTAYASKTAMPTEGGGDLEMISGTSNTENVEISFEISTAFLTAASGTVTLASVGAGETVTIRGLTYTAVTGTAGSQEFSIDGDDTADAAELVSSINTADGTLLTAANTLGVVTVTSDNSGTSGNAITMQKSGAGITLSGATLTGGTEYLENLPYDGSLTQSLTFTIDCIGA